MKHHEHNAMRIVVSPFYMPFIYTLIMAEPEMNIHSLIWKYLTELL